jgi:formate hydrogenlyase subunit 6/NADH:ubiquinone oxidoreductase subunit I
MKPVVNHKKCFADVKICTAKTACPVNAIGFVKVEEPMFDKELTPNVDLCPMCAAGLSCDLATPERNECAVGQIGTEENPIPVGDPYIRVVIDYDKCTLCGLCIDGCCGYAIEMVEE